MKRSFALAWVALALSMMAGGARGEVRYRTFVDVIQRNGCAVLQIAYHNNGSEIMYFEPVELPVRVRNASRKVLPFAGITADGPPFTTDQHVKLLPGKMLTREVALSESYGVIKPGKYSVWVNVGYYDPVHEKSYGDRMMTHHFTYSPGSTDCALAGKLRSENPALGKIQ